MEQKKMRMKLDYNNLLRLIQEVISNSCSKIVKENGDGIVMGMNLLTQYLRDIGERAIEIDDDVLIELLLDLHILVESEGNNNAERMSELQE